LKTLKNTDKTAHNKRSHYLKNIHNKKTENIEKQLELLGVSGFIEVHTTKKM